MIYLRIAFIVVHNSREKRCTSTAYGIFQLNPCTHSITGRAKRWNEMQVKQINELNRQGMLNRLEWIVKIYQRRCTSGRAEIRQNIAISVIISIAYFT